MPISQEVTDKIYNEYMEPGFDWMSERGFNKAVNALLNKLQIQIEEITQAGQEASECFLKEVAKNILLQEQLTNKEG